MPPKNDLPSLGTQIMPLTHNEFFIELTTLYSVKAELNLFVAVFNEIESKYRAVKKQLEIIADTSIEEGAKSEDKTITENLKSGEEI